MIIQVISDEMKSVEYPDLAAAVAAGMVQKGTSKNYADVLARNPGAAVPRQMLWDQPQFDGYAGPMYGRSYETGEDCLRYEGWKANDILSR